MHTQADRKKTKNPIAKWYEHRIQKGKCEIAENISLEIIIKKQVEIFELLKQAILQNIHAFYVLETVISYDQ